MWYVYVFSSSLVFLTFGPILNCGSWGPRHKWPKPTTSKTSSELWNLRVLQASLVPNLTNIIFKKSILKKKVILWVFSTKPISLVRIAWPITTLSNSEQLWGLKVTPEPLLETCSVGRQNKSQFFNNKKKRNHEEEEKIFCVQHSEPISLLSWARIGRKVLEKTKYIIDFGLCWCFRTKQICKMFKKCLVVHATLTKHTGLLCWTKYVSWLLVKSEFNRPFNTACFNYGFWINLFELKVIWLLIIFYWPCTPHQLYRFCR